MDEEKEISLISADSFKLRIPLDLATIKDNSLNKIVLEVIEETSEVVGKKYIKTKDFELDALKVTIGIEKQITSEKDYNNKQIVKPFLIIKTTSKLLKECYFEGITADNIHQLYGTLMSFDAVDFTLETFLNSELTDLDIKQDYVTTPGNFDILIDYLYNIAKQYKDINKGVARFNKNNNRGISFSSRRNATPSNPFLKIYHKGIELEHKETSKQFADRYLIGIDYSNNIRKEATIKDKYHFKTLGINDIRLKSILDLKQDKHREIMNGYLRRHIEKRYEVNNKVGGLCLMETVIRAFTVNLRAENYSVGQIIRMGALDTFKPTSRRKWEDKVREVYYQDMTSQEREISEDYDKLLRAWEIP